mmetsp:Transcript_92592/g.193573  ORF Transcript_92592/g.193573 Transcript_92592/m.193573 type:complete len:130 (-) Transcript_92592:1188-1577(-)
MLPSVGTVPKGLAEMVTSCPERPNPLAPPLAWLPKVGVEADRPGAVKPEAKGMVAGSAVAAIAPALGSPPPSAGSGEDRIVVDRAQLPVGDIIIPEGTVFRGGVDDEACAAKWALAVETALIVAVRRSE